MGTQANISVLHNDDTVSTIYLHWDGYEEHALEMLKAHYNTLEQAEALVALGNLSQLDASIECPEGHSFKTPVKGYTVAYHRDRGEDYGMVRIKAKHFRLNVPYHSYHYMFKDGNWARI